MNLTDITTAMDTNKGQPVIVTLTDGTNVTGDAISINSKGVNIKVEGKVRAFAVKRVASVTAPGAPAEGMTTADMAALVGTDPKSLRVQLRALGYGVGKGRRYTLTVIQLDQVRKHMATLDA